MCVLWVIYTAIPEHKHTQSCAAWCSYRHHILYILVYISRKTHTQKLCAMRRLVYPLVHRNCDATATHKHSIIHTCTQNSLLLMLFKLFPRSIVCVHVCVPIAHATQRHKHWRICAMFVVNAAATSTFCLCVHKQPNSKVILYYYSIYAQTQKYTCICIIILADCLNGWCMPVCMFVGVWASVSYASDSLENV